MKLKYPIILLIALVLVLMILFSLSVNDTEEETEYVVEEIVEPAEIDVPDEAAEIPTVEESEEEVEVLDEVNVEIVNGRFYPSSIIISPGTVVTWINKDNLPHKIVAYDRLFYGPRMNPGDTYSFTFTQEGSHRYFDGVFTKTGRGKIIVQEEPLPITGGVVAANLEEANAKLALLVILFVIMILGLTHGIYTSYK